MKRFLLSSLAIFASVVFCQITLAQTTVTYTQQTSEYDQSLTTSGSGGIYNNGTAEVGMWMNGDNSGNSFAGNVLWKTFRVGSAISTNNARSLQVGDEFRITVATKGFYYGTIGVSLNSGSLPSATWANRTANSRLRIQQDGLNFGGGSPGSWYYSNGTGTSFNITPTGSYVDYAITVRITGPNLCNVTLNGTTFNDVALGGTADAAITHFSIYMSDDRAGVFSSPNRGDSYWKQTTTVVNQGNLPIGGSNNSFTITSILGNGLAANSTSTSSTNSLTKSGTGNVTLSGANTYSGGTTINAGTLSVSADNNLGNSAGNVTLGGGTLAVTTGFSSSRNISSSNNSSIIDIASGQTFSTSGSLSGSNITKNGNGTLTLSTGSSYGGLTVGAGIVRLNGSANTQMLGNTTINSGATLRMAAANQFGTGAAPPFITVNGTFDATDNSAGNFSQNISLTGSGSITMGSGTLTIANTGTDTYSGTISGTGGIIKANTGTQTLSGVNTSLTGGVQVQQGILIAGHPNAINNTNTLTLGNSTNSGTFRLNGNNVTVTGITTSGSGTSNTIENNNATSATLTVNNSADFTYSGVLQNGASGTLNLSKSGAGNLTLSGANTYTGSTIITNGALTCGVANALPIGSSAGTIQTTTTSGVILNLGLFNLGTSTATANSAGQLDLDVNTTINLGSTGTNSYYFKASNGQTWGATTVTINNWTGTAGQAGTGRRIYVGASSSGLTSAQLASISFTGFSAGGQLLSTGELVPAAIPIISTISASPNNGTSTNAYNGSTITVQGNNFESSGMTITMSTGGTVSSYTFTSSSIISFSLPTGYAGTISITNSNGGPVTSVSSITNLGFITTQAGGWNTASTWLGNAVPTSATTTNVVIANNITSTTGNISVGQLTVNASTTLTISSGSTLTVNTASTNSGTINANGTLGVTGVTYTNSGTLNVAGAFQINQGGFVNGNNLVYSGSGTLVFNNSSGQYQVLNSHVYWPSTNGPTNVTLNNAGGTVQLTTGTSRTLSGTLTLNNTFDIQSSGLLTLNGGLTINAGNISSNAPIYGSSATLTYNTGTSYNVSNEWTGGNSSTPTAGTGVPANVTISGNTTVNIQGANGRGLPGNLQVDNGSTLTLGNASGGDIYLGGDYTQNGTLTNNGRAFFFTKASGTQVLTGSSTLQIPYLVFSSTGSRTVQLSGVDLNCAATNGGNAISFNSSSDIIDLNGRSITLGTAGQTCNINGSGFFSGNTASNFSIQGTTSTGNISFAGNINVNNFTCNLTSGGTSLGSDLIVNGTMTLTAGTVSISGRTLTFQNGNTPVSIGTGSLTPGTGASVVFGTSGNTGGNAFTLPNTLFTSAPTLSTLTINRTNSLTLGTQVITTSTLNLTAGTLINGSSLTLSAGATINRVAGILNSAPTFGTTVNLSYAQNGSQTTVANEWPSSATVLNNLTINTTNGVTFSGATRQVNGTLSLTTGTFTLGAGGILNIFGSISVSAGNIDASNGTSAVSFTSTSAQTVPSGTFTGTVASLTINNTNSTSGVTLAGNNTVTALNVTAGCTLTNSATLTINTSATINGTFRVTDAGTTSGTGTWTYGSAGSLGYTIAGNTYTIDGASAPSYWPSSSGPVNVAFVGNGATSFTINNFSRAIPTSGLFSLSLGSVSLSGSSVLTINGLCQMYGGSSFASGSPTYGSSSTLQYFRAVATTPGNEWTGNSTTAGLGNPQNVTIGAGTTVNLPASARALAGAMTIANGTLALNASATLTIGGNFTRQGAVSLTSAATTNGSSTITYASNSNVLQGALISGTGIPLGTTVLQVISATSAVLSANATATNTGQTFTITAATFTHNNSSVIFGGNNAQSIAVSGTGISNFYDVTVNNTSGGVSFTGSNTINRTLTLTSGAVNGTNLTLASAATINVTSGTMSAAPTFGTSVNINYNQNGSSITTGSEIPSTSSVLSNLTVNSTNGVTLNSAATVNGTLSLSAGTFTNGSNLTLANGATINRASGSLSDAPTFGSTANLVYSNASGITTGNEVPSGNVLSNCTVNGGATVTLGGSMRVGGALTLTSGKLDIGSNTLTLAGTVSGMSAANSLVGTSSSNLTVTSTSTVGSIFFDASNKSLGNFTVSGTGGTTTLGNAVDVFGVLNVSAGTLNVNAQNLTLKSSLSATASVDNVQGTISNATNVTVERFKTGSTRRVWLLATAPLSGAGATTGYVGGTSPNAGSIYGNWQQATQITGNSANGTTGGLDAGTANNWGILSWGGSSWSNVTNTTNANSLFGNAGGTTADNKSFFLFVRGDRSISPIAYSGSAATANLASNGSLQQGNKTYTFSGSSYALVGNPYPAPINLESFRTANANQNGTFYYWDPNLNSNGGYVTCVSNGSGSYTLTPSGGSAMTNQNVYIQSGQAFFIRPTSGSTVSFTESMKSVGNSSNNVFGSSNSNGSSVTTFGINLFTTDTTNTYRNLDGVAQMYDNTYSKTVNTQTEDAAKFFGGGEGLAIRSAATNLSIEKRPIPQDGDTVELNIRGLKSGFVYDFKAQGYMMPSNLSAYYLDKYTNTLQYIDWNNNQDKYSFSIDNNPASKATNRFAIVFKAGNPLSVSAIKLQGIKNERSGLVELSWKVENQQNVAYYAIQRKLEGTNEFKEIGKVNATSSAEYKFIDNDKTAGNQIYQVKVVNNNGTTQRSNIIFIKNDNTGVEALQVSPNPVTTRTMVIKPQQIALGKYEVAVYNLFGQRVHTQTIQYAGGNIEVTLDNPLSAGKYLVQLQGKAGNFTGNFIVK